MTDTKNAPRQGRGRVEIQLCFSGAAQNGLDFMGDHIFNSGAGRGEVLTGIEVRWILRQIFANASGHCETEVGVNVDFADSHLGSFAEHFLRNTDSIRHLTAVDVYKRQVLPVLYLVGANKNKQSV